MKRFTKICLILAAVLTALGMIGVGVGFLLGAKPEQLAGNLSYTTPSLSRSHGQNKDSNSSDSSEYTYDSAIRRLELDVNYASVTIGTSEDDHISVKARNAGKYFKETVEDGDMLVLEDERPKGKATLELEILLPDRVLEEMDLDLGAAELTADRLQARQFSLDIGAGAGTIQSLLTSEDASLDIDVGELTIGYFDGSDLELDCDTGQLNITVAGEEQDYNYDLECGIGSIDIGGSSYSGLSSSHSVDNGAARTISADCGMGAISLRFAGEQPASHDHDIETGHSGSEL